MFVLAVIVRWITWLLSGDTDVCIRRETFDRCKTTNVTYCPRVEGFLSLARVCAECHLLTFTSFNKNLVSSTSS